MKRSLSGEYVLVGPRCTLKRGSAMVGRQGQIMRAVRHMVPQHVPKVYYVGRTCYLMETVRESCGPPAYSQWDWGKAAMSMGTYWDMPEGWFYKDAPNFDPMALYDYIEEQGWTSNMDLPSLPFLELYYKSASPRLTHGDLTHANTVINVNGQYQFIDWQAQRHPYIPAHRDVDYGKMLQSLMGWDRESLTTRDKATAEQVRLILQRSRMAWFWCAIHFMRIKNRTKDEWQKNICDHNIEYSAWLGEKVHEAS